MTSHEALIIAVNDGTIKSLCSALDAARENREYDTCVIRRNLILDAIDTMWGGIEQEDTK